MDARLRRARATTGSRQSGCRMPLSLTAPSPAPQATLRRLSPALGHCQNVTPMEPGDAQPVGLLTRHLGLKGRPAVFANSRVPSAARPGATGRRSPRPAKLPRLSVRVRECSRLSRANAGAATVCVAFQGAARRSPPCWPRHSPRRLACVVSGEIVRLGSLRGCSALPSGAEPVLGTLRTHGRLTRPPRPGRRL